MEELLGEADDVAGAADRQVVDRRPDPEGVPAGFLDIADEQLFFAGGLAIMSAMPRSSSSLASGFVCGKKRK